METKQDAIKKAVLNICNGFSELFGVLGTDNGGDQSCMETNEEDPSLWVDSKMAAEMMGCTRQTVANRGASGIVLRKNFGARWRYYKPSIESFMRYKRLN